MTVSTRSKKLIINKAQKESNENQRINLRTDQQDSKISQHHGLIVKMKALSLFYGQQQKQAAESRFSTHPSVDLLRNDRRIERTEKEIKAITHEIIPGSNSNSNRDFVISKPSFGENSKEKTAAPQAPVVGGGGERVSEKLGSRIHVYVRLRPMSKQEKEVGSRSCVKIMNKGDVYLTEFANENDYLRLKRLKDRHFTFDASFADSTTQLEVYSTTAAEVVEAVLQGKNGSIFCYGATGAGKTFTMLGTSDNPGVMILAINDLFNRVMQRNLNENLVVHLSYLEVYNESVRDLLSPGRPLVLREDKQGIVASGLTQYRAFTADEVMALLQKGNQNRTTEPTRVNETSSRSHAILQVVIEYKIKDGGSNSNNMIKRIGKLSLIDLAGSERALATEQRTLRSLEGANINRSLLALSSCINALVEGKRHVPYRDSKLTQLLKDSLGGACNTVMIANISPSDCSFSETQNTLHWADRAKKIRTKACDPNEEIQVPDQVELLIKLQKENRELRMQLTAQQQNLVNLQTQTMAANSTPSSKSSYVQTIEKRKARPNFLSSNCFNSSDSNRKEMDEKSIARKLQKTVQALKSEMKRLKKAYDLQIKEKDDLIHELMIRNSHVLSPDHKAKKRSCLDISTAVITPSNIATVNGRKMGINYVYAEPVLAAGTSMLLQPGFTRQRSETKK